MKWAPNMPLVINALQPTAANKRRLIEDMAKTLAVFIETEEIARPLYPSNAALGELGRLFLAGELSADIANDPDMRRIVQAWHYPVFSGAVRMSYFLMSIVIACRPCWETGADAQLDLDQGVRWLLLEGVHQLRLWPFLAKALIRQLRTPAIHIGGTVVSPLEWCALFESRDRFPRSQDSRRFTEWLLSVRSDGRSFFWAHSMEELRAQLLTPSRLQIGCGDLAPSAFLRKPEPDPQIISDYVYPDLGSGYCFRPLTLKTSDERANAYPYAKGAASTKSLVADIPLSPLQGMVVIGEIEPCEPELRKDLHIRLKIDEQFEAIVPCAHLNTPCFFVPVVLREPGRRMELDFLRGSGDDISKAIRETLSMRSLAVWQI